MSFFSVSRVSNRQPQHVPKIDWSNPITKGLVFCAVPLNNTAIDLVTGVIGTPTGVSTLKVMSPNDGYSQRSVGLASVADGGAATRIDWPASSTLRGATMGPNGTILVLGGTTEQVDGKFYQFGGNCEGGNGYGYSVGIDSYAYAGRGYVTRGSYSGNSSATSSPNGLGSSFGNKTHFFGYGFNSHGVNGTWFYSRTTMPWTGQPAMGAITTGRVATILAPSPWGVQARYGYNLLTLFWDRELSVTEYTSLYDNPWQIFKPEERFFYISSGTGGAYTLTASGGTYTVQGASAGIFRSRVLSGTGGSYTLTGGQAVVSRNRKLVASGGIYNYTGQSITITHTGTSNAYTLTAQGGSYALSGGIALILKSKRITSVGGVYTLTGSDAVVLKSKYLTAASGTYSLTGGTATVLKSKMLISTGGVYSYTGSSTVIKKSKYLSALGGSYSLVGSSVVLVHGGIGGIVWPPVHLVVLGTAYGPTGSEYTGTLDVNGIKYDITTGQLVKPISDKVVMSL